MQMQVSSTISLLRSSTTLTTPSLHFSKSPSFHYSLSPTPQLLTTTLTTAIFTTSIWTPQIPPFITRVSSSSSSYSSSSENQTVTVASPPTTTTTASASDVVKSFYEGINGHDLGSVEELIADYCVYEDLIFPRPFVGREAIMDFFNKFVKTISRDLRFVIDDISTEDSSCVGVIWHLEWKGKPFPFSKGCSFYRLEVVNGQRQIVYGRDSVEPAIKPGETALVIIRAVTWLLQKFPQLVDQL